MSQITNSSLSQVNNLVEFPYDDREIKRGEIYYVDLEDLNFIPTHISNKNRPALVIQNNMGNLQSKTVIIALMTTTFKKSYPFQYVTDATGKTSVIMFEQILTIDKYRLGTKVCELTPKQLKEADEKLMYSLALNRFSLDNVYCIEVLSVNTKKTKTKIETFFEIKLTFSNYTYTTVNVSLDKLKNYNSQISENTEFDDLCKLLDCCKGLNWLVNNTDI
jgi:mRNA interferase MazF